MEQNQLQPVEKAKSWMKDLFEQWRQAVLAPIQLYENLSDDDNLKEPTIFVSAVALVNALFIFLYLAGKPSPEGIAGSLGNAAGSGLMMIVAFVGGSYAWAGLTMYLCRMLGSEVSFQRTYRVCAYASAPNVFFWLPLVNVFMGIYSIMIFKIGLEQVHQLSKQRATTIVLIEVVVWLVIGALAALASFNALVKPGTTPVS